MVKFKQNCLDQIAKINRLLMFSAFYETCSLEDFACLAMAANDRLGFQAIKSLHQKLDDDANGNIDYSESDDVRTFQNFPLNSFLLLVCICIVVFAGRTAVRFRI